MLHNDGTWDPLPPRKLEQVAVSAPAPAPAAKQVDTLDLADSDTEAEAGAADTEGAKVAPEEEEEVVEDDGEDCVITLDRYKHVFIAIRLLLPDAGLLAAVKNYFHCNF